jgi:hypothetical protein
VVALEGEPIAWHVQPAMSVDADDPRLPRGRVHGPAKVTFHAPVRLSDRGGRLVAHGTREGEPGDVVVVGGRMSMEIRP